MTEFNNNSVKVKKFHPEAKLPTKAHPTDAGYDLYALESIEISGGEFVEWFNTHTEKIRTGVGIEIPAGYVGLIWDRSSMGAKGLNVHGGVIDHGYTGEISVCLCNNTEAAVVIDKGAKIAQIVIQPVSHFELELVEEFTETERGDGGFGSTGV